MTTQGHRPYRVVVAVGTDHHPFDRLVQWADRWAARHPDVRVLVQRGEAPGTETADSAPMLAWGELVAAMATAEVVVTHGGPATIMDARSVGRRPVVVPRRPELGEHVDGHQVTFATWMADRDLVAMPTTEAEFDAHLDRILVDPAAWRIPPDADNIDSTLIAFRAVVDPLLVRPRPPGRRSTVERAPDRPSAVGAPTAGGLG